MLRLHLVALSMFAVGAFAEAHACTTLVSPHKQGSSEAIAEDIQFKKERAVFIASNDLVFVGKTVRERLPRISEITPGIVGRWDEIPGVRSWFEPVRVLKGKADFPTTNIFSGMYGSTCGYGPSLEIGKDVIVFARKQDGYWFGAVAQMDILPYLEPLLR